MFEPIRSETAAELSSEAFHTAQLTLVSIIQGLAFTLVVQNSFTLCGGEKTHLQCFIRIGPYVIASLFAVAVITLLYFVFASIFRGPLTIWDFLIPFFIGFAESASTFHYSNILFWWFWVGALCGVAVFAYGYTLFKIKKESFPTSESAYRHTRQVILRFMLLALCCAIVAACSAYSLYTGYANTRNVAYCIIPIYICQYLASRFCSRFVVQFKKDLSPTNKVV